MATITICDLCKQRLTGEPTKLAFVVSEDAAKLASHRVGDSSCEICPKCTKELLDKINNVEVVKSKSCRAVEELPSLTGPIEVAAPLKKKRGRPKKEAERPAPTEDLLPGEMQKVSSNFNKRAAEAQVSKEKGGCQHPFKSFEDGVITCVDPPDGYTGEGAQQRGCGKRLTDKEI